MAKLVFFEKPGCVGNAQQKSLLRAQGIELQVLDLLSEPWSVRTLRPFFGDLPVPDWFNQSAPKVRDGLLDIHACTETEALQWMLAEPLLIRRPLLQLGDLQQSGFVAGPVLEALGVSLDSEQDLQSCPMQAEPSTAAADCGSPA